MERHYITERKKKKSGLQSAVGCEIRLALFLFFFFFFGQALGAARRCNLGTESSIKRCVSSEKETFKNVVAEEDIRLAGLKWKTTIFLSVIINMSRGTQVH